MTGMKLGVIGGSGLYRIDGLTGTRWQTIHTPWGAPSDAILTGRLDGLEMAFLPRHGRGHVHGRGYRHGQRRGPADMSCRADLHALKSQGIIHVAPAPTCGSFRAEGAVGPVVPVDQVPVCTESRGNSLEDVAVKTAPDQRDPAQVAALSVVAGRVL